MLTNTTWTATAYVGGALTLDFLNTAGGKTKSRVPERLVDLQALVSWSLTGQLITEVEAQTLQTLAFQEPVNGAQAVAHLTRLREATHDFLNAVIAAESPRDIPQDIGDWIHQAYAAAELKLRPGQPMDWNIQLEKTGLATIGLRLALSLSDFLRSPELQMTKVCKACSWMFVDSSRSRRRQWCSMATCGNRAKAHRHYHG
ncbi:CGNR zinc finger domain-containing protein [Pseudomonas batumici]|uniref:CGNR zinc finger domain-containing protein n=1 Tax=Pseudomonas batumici TaxID=226910 RepID=UPI0030CD7F12